jgi:hypothetical protein
LKPPLGVIVTVDVADPPGETDDGDKAEAAIVKPWKVAVTAAFEVKVMMQLVPVQAPLHAVKAELVPGAGASVTLVPGWKLAEQVPGQLIPVGLLVTFPVPTTVTAMVGMGVKVAVTASSFVRVIAQVPVPVHPPDQPAKKKFVPGVSVSVTLVLIGKVAEHVPVVPVAQLMPAGVLVTVPVPPTVTETFACVGVKVAVTASLEFRVIKHVPVPVHPPPLHPLKAKFAPAAAVSVTLVPGWKLAEHVPGQLIPVGLLVTFPVPTMVTERAGSNVAVTDWGEFRVTTHCLVPEHPPPLQPAKVKLVPGVAVSVT